MYFAPSFFEHLEDRLNLAVYDTNQELRMSAIEDTGNVVRPKLSV